MNAQIKLTSTEFQLFKDLFLSRFQINDEFLLDEVDSIEIINDGRKKYKKYLKENRGHISSEFT